MSRTPHLPATVLPRSFVFFFLFFFSVVSMFQVCSIVRATRIRYSYAMCTVTFEVFIFVYRFHFCAAHSHSLFPFCSFASFCSFSGEMMRVPVKKAYACLYVYFTFLCIFCTIKPTLLIKRYLVSMLFAFCFLFLFDSMQSKSWFLTQFSSDWKPNDW